MRFRDLRSPRFALLAILLLALRLSSGVIAPFLATASTPTQHAQGGSAVLICPVTGMPMPGMAGTDAPSESHYAMGAHCPFCLAGHASLALLRADFSFSLPEPVATVFLPPSSAGFQPSIPDERHAPKRAPPSFA
ncbi:MAG: DUF2946 family protein [Candidatus Accumulibacter sp.]|jgi:hypothetical protein|nr:DUF2946 family protein [Accumulibacter sp.]